MNNLEMLINQSEDNVAEAMFACLDKADMMLEYAGYDNDAVADYIAEMFDIFMEATSRRKKADEIDEYMRKHNWGDVNAKTPANAKKARQLRNFLIMQDFDPKTGTIKSDVDGHRVKFNINNRDDSHYNLRDKSINLQDTSKKQQNRSMTLKHEKGHNKFDVTGQSDYWKYEEDPYERGIKHIRQAINAGKDINPHDDGSYMMPGQQGFMGIGAGGENKNPEEIEADLHAAKNTRVRTKYAGRKRAVKRSGATRNVTTKEIEKWYINMQKEMDDFSSIALSHDTRENYKKTAIIPFLKKFKASIPKIESAEQFYEFLKNNIAKYKMLYESKFSMDLHFDEKSDDKLRQDIRELRELLTEKSFANIDIERYEKRIQSDKEFTERNPNSEYGLNSLERSKKKYQESLDKLNEILAKIKSYESAIKTDYYKFEICIRHFDVNYYSIKQNNSFDELASYIQDDVSNTLKDLKQNLDVFDELIRIFNSNLELDKFKKEYDNAVKQVKKEHRDFMLAAKDTKPNDSTQMRHDFVKKYLHECFEEFMLDYYSYENVFGDYMED